jgi:hypothetical protein
MHTRRGLALLPLAVVLCLLAGAGAGARAQQPEPGYADAVLGRWDITVQAPDGPYPSWVEIQLRKETEIMGRFVGRSGSQRHASRVEYTGGTLTFEVPVQYEPHTSPLVFTGRLAGERLEGTTQAPTGETLRWVGARAPQLIRERAPSWGAPVELFNGRDLSGWRLRGTERGTCWRVQDGLLVNTPPCLDILTDQTFTDFQLHVEFRYPEGSNSGVYLRGRYEVQIQDDRDRPALDPLRMGGVYGFLRPQSLAARKPGEWQTFDITLIGRRVTVLLNGTRIIHDAEIPGITGGALDSDEGAPGPILLQGDHGPIEFRKVTLTPVR